MSKSSYPVFLVCGVGGSGKDTLASYIQKYVPGTALLAHADPMKRLARHIFDFTEEQLWGPSATRNAPDPRYATSPAWTEAYRRLCDIKTRYLIQEFHPGVSDHNIYNLFAWFWDVAREHGFGPNDGGRFTDSPYAQAVPTTESLFPAFARDHRPFAPRYALQTIGTEWGRRKVSADLWIRYVNRVSDELLHDHSVSYDPTRGLVPEKGSRPLVGITDGRVRAEVLNARHQGWSTIHVYAPFQEQPMAAGVAGHGTETELSAVPDAWYDFAVVNDKSRGLLALENKAAQLAIDLAPSPAIY